jgi:excinuclease ABC subunit B
LDETNRRRQKQIAYNKAHNITPKTIKKEISNTLMTMTEFENNSSSKKKSPTIDISEIKNLNKEIKRLQKEMKKYAEDLEFEKAMELRDKIKYLSQFLLLKDEA